MRRWGASGLLQAAFCRRHKLRDGQFSWWKQWLAGITARGEGQSDAVAPAFVSLLRLMHCLEFRSKSPRLRQRIRGVFRRRVFHIFNETVRYFMRHKAHLPGVRKFPSLVEYDYDVRTRRLLAGLKRNAHSLSANIHDKPNIVLDPIKNVVG
jgi:hypothetical protein